MMWTASRALASGPSRNMSIPLTWRNTKPAFDKRRLGGFEVRAPQQDVDILGVPDG